MADPFKQCSCRKTWKSRDDFLSDPQVEFVGYQVSVKKPEEGLFLFNHKVCKTTLGLEVVCFADLYDGPVYTQSKMGTTECPAYCLKENNFEICNIECSMAHIRKLIPIIRSWPKK